MAGKDFTLRATPAAATAIDRLRGKSRKSYAAFEAELRTQGCGVAGYRLLGAEVGCYSGFCCKRLVDDWRVITTFEPGVAIVVAVGRHDSRASMPSFRRRSRSVPWGGSARRSRPAAGKGGWPSIGSVSMSARVR
jgi:hypothetical protein